MMDLCANEVAERFDISPDKVKNLASRLGIGEKINGDMEFIEEELEEIGVWLSNYRQVRAKKENLIEWGRFDDPHQIGWIYKINFKLGTKILSYIGKTSGNLGMRFMSHIDKLYAGAHHSGRMQYFFDKMEADITVEKIAVVSEEDIPTLDILTAQEDYWINHFKTHMPDRGFNVAYNQHCKKD
jgi:hypothetical protein